MTTEPRGNSGKKASFDMLELTDAAPVKINLSRLESPNKRKQLSKKAKYKILDSALLADLSAQAKVNPRLRKHLNLHSTDSEGELSEAPDDPGWDADRGESRRATRPPGFGRLPADENGTDASDQCGQHRDQGQRHGQ